MLLKKLRNLFKDHYWDFYMWSQTVPIDTHISVVKEQLPDYIVVDWERPTKFGNGLLYEVTYIKGHRKTPIVSYLGFVNELYCGCTKTHRETFQTS